MPILRDQLFSCLGKLLESQLDVFGFGERCCYLVTAAVGSVKCRSPRDSTKGKCKFLGLRYLCLVFIRGLGLSLKSLLLVKSPEVRWRVLGGKTTVMNSSRRVNVVLRCHG